MSIIVPRARTGVATVVGLLACQADSYARQLTTRVVACVPSPPHGYEVEFQDTVLFPEGGGQPNDKGVLFMGEKASKAEESTDQTDKINVLNVQRDGLTPVHLVDKPLEPGSTVTMAVDWPRRLDHMQQHTGQHLLSAVLDQLGVETVGWNMGAKFNYVELPRALTASEVDQVQGQVEDLISQAMPVRIERPNGSDVTDEVKGVIRIVHIGTLDANPCCGTHLSSTLEIGGIALLHQEKVRGTNSRLFFMAGRRVWAYAREAHAVVRGANASLSCQTDEIGAKIARLNSQVKDLTLRERHWMGRTSEHEAVVLSQRLQSNGVVVYHTEAGPEFVRALEKQLPSGLVGTLVLVSGTPKTTGAIVVMGPRVDEVAKRIKEAVPGVKGGGKGKWQGKVVAWEGAELQRVKDLDGM